MANKTYSYRICVDTFPKPDPNNMWEKIIKHALEQWEFETGGLVTMTHSGNDCADYAVFISRIETEVTNEHGVSFSSSEIAEVRDLIGDLLDQFQESGLVTQGDYEDTVVSDQTGNDIRMVNDMDTFVNKLIETRLLREIGAGIGYNCHLPEGIAGYARRNIRGGTTDILLRRSAVDPTVVIDANRNKSIDHTRISMLRIPGGDDGSIDEGDVRLSVCPNPGPYATASVTLSDWRAYDALVHESGHALGINEGGDVSPQSQHAHHPMAHDSAMNIRGAKHCSPAPLDILAIYSLYQTIN